MREGRARPVTLPAERLTRSTRVVPDCSSREPDGDGEGVDGLNDGGVELDHHGPRQLKLPQLPQEVHPLLGFLEGIDVQPPFQVPGEDCAYKAGRLHRSAAKKS